MKILTIAAAIFITGLFVGGVYAYTSDMYSLEVTVHPYFTGMYLVKLGTNVNVSVSDTSLIEYLLEAKGVKWKPDSGYMDIYTNLSVQGREYQKVQTFEWGNVTWDTLQSDVNINIPGIKEIGMANLVIFCDIHNKLYVPLDPIKIYWENYTLTMTLDFDMKETPAEMTMQLA